MSKVLKLLITFLSIVIIQPSYANPHAHESDNFKIEHKGGGWYLQEAGIFPLYHEGVNLYPDFAVGIYDNGITPSHEDLHKRVKNVNKMWVGYDNQGKLTSVKTPPSKVIEISTHGNMVTGIFSGGIIGNDIGTRGIINTETRFIGQYAPVSFSFVNNTFTIVGESSDNTVKGLEKLLNLNKKPKIISTSMALSPNTSMHVLKETPKLFNQGEHFKATRVTREFIENNPDVLFVVMAGNTGRDAKMSNGAIHYDLDPKSFPTTPPKNSLVWKDEKNYTYQPLNNLIIVGAYLNDNALASYSAFGESVDIVAPTDVMSIACSDGSDEHRYIINESYGDNKQSFSDFSSTVWNRVLDMATSDTCKTPNHLADGTSTSTPITAGISGLLFSIKSDLPPESIKGYLVHNAGGVVSSRHTSGGTELISTGSIPKVNANSAYKTLMQNLGYNDSISRTKYNFEQYLKSYNTKYLAGSSGTGDVTLGDERIVKSTTSGYPECLASNTSAECGNGTIDTLGECLSVWHSFIGLTPVESGYQTSLFSDNACHYKEEKTGRTIVYNADAGKVNINNPSNITMEELKQIIDDIGYNFFKNGTCIDSLNYLKNKLPNMNSVSIFDNPYSHYDNCYLYINNNLTEFLYLQGEAYNQSINTSITNENDTHFKDAKLGYARSILIKEYKSINSDDECSAAANAISDIISIDSSTYYKDYQSCNIKYLGYSYPVANCTLDYNKNNPILWRGGCSI